MKSNVKRQTSMNKTSKAFGAFRVTKPIPKAQDKTNLRVIEARPSIDEFRRTAAKSNTQQKEVAADPTKLLKSQNSAAAEAPVVRPTLNESDRIYQDSAAEIRAARMTPYLHSNPGAVETILRNFDLTSKYGPCVGMTRLERFNRAKKLGMKPPEEIDMILRVSTCLCRNDVADLL